jgi:hypothetical protein
MGAVAVAQHLHAMAAALRYNNVPRAIKLYAPGLIELPVPCSTAADAAQVHPVAVPQDLNAMVATIAHHQVALAIKRNAVIRSTKLFITSTTAALPMTRTKPAPAAATAPNHRCQQRVDFRAFALFCTLDDDDDDPGGKRLFETSSGCIVVESHDIRPNTRPSKKHIFYYCRDLVLNIFKDTCKASH